MYVWRLVHFKDKNCTLCEKTFKLQNFVTILTEMRVIRFLAIAYIYLNIYVNGGNPLTFLRRISPTPASIVEDQRSHQFFSPKVLFDFMKAKHNSRSSAVVEKTFSQSPSPSSPKVLFDYYKATFSSQPPPTPPSFPPPPPPPSLRLFHASNHFALAISATMTLAHIAPIIVNKLFNLFRSFRNPNKTKPQTVQSSTEAIKASVNVNLKKIQCVEDLLRTALKAENLPPSPSLPTTLWSVDLLSTSYSYSRHVLILNFLKGEKGDVEKTLNLILSHLKYRLDNDIPDVPMYDENTPPPPRDKLGRPVMLMAVADFKINAVFSTKQSFVEWRIRELEKTIALFDWATVNSCVFVQDFRGFKLFGGLPSKVKEGISAFSKVKKDSYPEITAQSLFVNVPRIVQMLFSGIRLVIPARTMKKITIVQVSERAKS